MFNILCSPRPFLAFLLVAAPSCGGSSDAADSSPVDGVDEVGETNLVDSSVTGDTNSGDSDDAVADTASDTAPAEDSLDSSGAEADTSGPAIASAVIGPGGGTLTSVDGAVTLTVPEDAVEEDTTFTIALEPDAFGQVRIGPAYRLGPENVDFRAEITLTIDYSGYDLSEVDLSDLIMLVFDDELGEWLGATPSTLDETAKTVSSPRFHFSEYAIGERLKALKRLSPDAESQHRIRDTVYVTADGDDLATGERDLPWRTLEHAQDILSQRKWRRTLRDGQVLVLDYGAVKTIELGSGTFGPVGLRIPASLRGQGRDQTFVKGGITLRVHPGEVSEITAEAVYLAGGQTARSLLVKMPEDRGAGITVGGRSPRVIDVEVVGPGRFTGAICIEIYKQTSDLRITDSKVQWCEVGIAFVDPLMIDGQQFPGTAYITTTDIIDNNFGLNVVATAQPLEVRHSLITGNLAGARIYSPSVNLGTPGGNIISCNSIVDVEAHAPVDASNNKWDHVPPAVFDGLSDDLTLNDIQGPVTTTGARLADNPCVAPKKECSLESRPPALVVFGNENTCSKGLQGVITCGGIPAPLCELQVPAADATSQCVTPNESILESPRVAATAPPSVTVSGANSGCAATRSRGGETYTSTVETGTLRSTDACEFVVGSYQGTVAAPAPLAIAAGGLFGVASGLDTALTVPDLAGSSILIHYDLRHQSDESVRASATAIVPISDLVAADGGMRTAPLASPELQAAFSASGFAPESVRACSVNTIEVAGLLSDGAPLNLACGRCATLAKRDFTACSDEICDGIDNDCDGTTDEGCPIRYSWFGSDPLVSEFYGDGPFPLPTFDQCPFPSMGDGLCAKVHSSGRVSSFGLTCGEVDLVKGTESTPFTFDVGTTHTVSCLVAGAITESCPEGYVLDGVRALMNDGVEQIQGRCSRWQITGSNGAWSTTVATTTWLPPIGTGTGEVAEWIVPNHALTGAPGVIRGLRGRYGAPVMRSFGAHGTSSQLDAP